MLRRRIAYWHPSSVQAAVDSREASQILKKASIRFKQLLKGSSTPENLSQKLVGACFYLVSYLATACRKMCEEIARHVPGGSEKVDDVASTLPIWTCWMNLA